MKRKMMDREKKFFQACSPVIQQWIQANVKFGESAIAAVEAKLVGENAPATADEKASTTPPPVRKRAARKSVTPSEFYEPYILKHLLRQPNRRARAKDVVAAVFHQLSVGGRLKDIDYLKTGGNGVIRAENKIMFARNSLKDRGLLVDPASDPSVYGQWVLTPKGVAEAKKVK